MPTFTRRYKSTKDKPTMDGLTFDSAIERDHYVLLKALASRGHIRDLEIQPRFPFIVNGVTVGQYTADFAYTEKNGQRVIQDVKAWKKSKKTGKRLPIVSREFAMQKRLLLALYGLEVDLV